MTADFDPVALVRGYLAAMERRDFDAAAEAVAPGAVFVFPGGRQPADIRAIAANSGGRYHHVAKRFDGFDVADGGRVVYAYGTLYGEWTDGTPFSDIRFIDRFEIRDRLIVSQRVWNDAGEARLARLAE